MLDRWKCNDLGWHPPDSDERKIWIRSKNAVLEGKDAELKLEAMKGPSTKKRPQGWIRAATEFNECLHFDHCSLPTSAEGHTKVLLLKDQYSGYLKAVPCMSTGAEEVVTALKSWIHQHGALSRFHSDGAQGLVGKEVSELASPWGLSTT